MILLESPSAMRARHSRAKSKAREDALEAYKLIPPCKGLMTGSQWLVNHQRVQDVKETNDSIRARMEKKGKKATINDLVKVWDVEEADRVALEERRRRLTLELMDTYR